MSWSRSEEKPSMMKEIMKIASVSSMSPSMFKKTLYNSSSSMNRWLWYRTMKPHTPWSFQGISSPRLSHRELTRTRSTLELLTMPLVRTKTILQWTRTRSPSTTSSPRTNPIQTVRWSTMSLKFFVGQVNSITAPHITSWWARGAVAHRRG